MRLFGNGCRITVHIHAQAFSHVIACSGRAVLSHVDTILISLINIDGYILVADCTSIVKDVFAQTGIASCIRIAGISWNGNNYQKITVEERSYEDYMYCCPIPNSEILKYSNLIQNKGWK